MTTLFDEIKAGTPELNKRRRSYAEVQTGQALGAARVHLRTDIKLLRHSRRRCESARLLSQREGHVVGSFLDYAKATRDFAAAKRAALGNAGATVH